CPQLCGDRQPNESSRHFPPAVGGTMSNAHDRVVEILRVLDVMLPRLLQETVQTVLNQSPQTHALVNELESNGYQLTLDLTHALRATPLESVFVSSLNHFDRMFLSGLRVKLSDEGK